MCLAVVSTTHPSYAFILLSNRDEFLHRTTARADWWEAPDGHVLGGRDLQHASRGTWLGVTKQGRVALLTNYREEGELPPAHGARSRGELAKGYLTVPPASKETPAQYAERLIHREGIQELDGFSLIFGLMHDLDDAGTREPLGIISNRTPDAKDTTWVAGNDKETFGQTCALSNSRYGDNAWKKVVDAEKLLDRAIQRHAGSGASEFDLIDACFEALSVDTLPVRTEHEEKWQDYTYQLRNTVFVPPIILDYDKTAMPVPQAAKAGSAIYGTQKQTVVLVDRAGKVTFVERTLYDHNALRLDPKDQDRRFDFEIERSPK